MAGFRLRLLAAASVALCLTAGLARAEDGYDLWLRYKPVETAALPAYRSHATTIVAAGSSPTVAAAVSELKRGLSGMLAGDVTTGNLSDGAIVIGTPASSDIVKSLNLPLAGLGDEGFVIRSTAVRGHPVTVIAGNTDVGVLYGAFRYLSLIETRKTTDALNIADAPKLKVRVLDHWDNLDGTVERGYSGRSIWDWWRLPDLTDARYIDYARADASVTGQ